MGSKRTFGKAAAKDAVSYNTHMAKKTGVSQRALELTAARINVAPKIFAEYEKGNLKQSQVDFLKTLPTTLQREIAKNGDIKKLKGLTNKETKAKVFNMDVYKQLLKTPMIKVKAGGSVPLEAWLRRFNKTLDTLEDCIETTMEQSKSIFHANHTGPLKELIVDTKERILQTQEIVDSFRDYAFKEVVVRRPRKPSRAVL